mgnify:CR=1 FL=1
MATTSIEELWRQLAASAGASVQTRIDATHPLDIYADVELPDRVALVAVCGAPPPDVRPMRALDVETGQRSDGRFTLRLLLLERQLLPVFAALCRDIVTSTRAGVEEARLGQVVVQRLVHWRALLERKSAGLGEATLRGLIGELLVLHDRLLPTLGPVAAVGSWRGPLGAPQDFVMPNGRAIEVKTIRPSADRIRVNGLAQLDAAGGQLTLTVIRADLVPPETPGARTAPALIAALRAELAPEPEAVVAFGAALNGLGWHEHPSHEDVALRVVRIEDHDVDAGFPRLIPTTVPTGVLDADYEIALPNHGASGAEDAQ